MVLQLERPAKYWVCSGGYKGEGGKHDGMFGYKPSDSGLGRVSFGLHTSKRPYEPGKS